MWVCLKDGPKFSHLAQSETNHFLLAKILLSVIPWSLTKIKFQHWHWQANIIRVAPQRTLLRVFFARLGPPLRGPAKNTRSSVRRSGGSGEQSADLHGQFARRILENDKKSTDEGKLHKRSSDEGKLHKRSTEQGKLQKRSSDEGKLHKRSLDEGKLQKDQRILAKWPKC